MDAPDSVNCHPCGTRGSAPAGNRACSSVVLDSRLFALTLVLALCGCYPHPHNVWVTQPFSGVLLNGGTPMSGVDVTVSHTRADSGDSCERPESVATTDDAGKFEISARVERHLFTSLLNPPQYVFQQMSVCFTNHGKHKLGAVMISASHYQVNYTATCEWNSSGVEFKGVGAQLPVTKGICTRTASFPRAKSGAVPWRSCGRGLASCCRRIILAPWPTCLNPLPAVAPSAVAVPGPFSVESCASASVSPILLEGVKRRCGFIRYAQRTSGPRRSLKRLRELPMGCLIGRGSSVRHARAWHINGSSALTGLNDPRLGRPSVAVAMNLSSRGVGVFALFFTRRGGLLLGDTCISGVARLTLRRGRSWNRFCSSART